jgi:cyclophilin family peptidyl-prolyl cis-trans isomerase
MCFALLLLFWREHMINKYREAATRHAKNGVALAKRRPLLFLGVWLAKWIVVYALILFLGHSTTANTGSSSATNHPEPIRGDVGGREGTTMTPHATIVTDLGDIVLQFFPEDAPKTVANFIALAHRGFFNDTTLYRYEPFFVLQGGGWPAKSSPLPPVPLEYHIPNYKFHVSTARTSDPNSATCEYSIMLNDNSKWLGPGGSDPFGYAVFARVVDGFDVIEKFSQVKRRKQGLTMLDPAVRVHTWTIHER